MLGVDLKPNLIKRFLVIELYSGFFKYVGNKFNRVYTESTSWNSECPPVRTIKTLNKIEISFFQNIAYEDVDYWLWLYFTEQQMVMVIFNGTMRVQ